MCTPPASHTGRRDDERCRARSGVGSEITAAGSSSRCCEPARTFAQTTGAMGPEAVCPTGAPTGQEALCPTGAPTGQDMLCPTAAPTATADVVAGHANAATGGGDRDIRGVPNTMVGWIGVLQRVTCGAPGGALKEPPRGDMPPPWKLGTRCKAQRALLDLRRCIAG